MSWEGMKRGTPKLVVPSSPVGVHVRVVPVGVLVYHIRLAIPVGVLVHEVDGAILIHILVDQISRAIAVHVLVD